MSIDVDELLRKRGYKSAEEKALEVIKPKSYKTRQTNSFNPTENYKVDITKTKSKGKPQGLSLQEKQNITNVTKQQKYISPAKEILKSQTELPKSLTYGPTVKKSDPIQTVRKTTGDDIIAARGYVNTDQNQIEPEIDYWKEKPLYSLGENVKAGFGMLGRGATGIIDATLGDRGIEPVDNWLNRSKDYIKQQDEKLAEINKGTFGEITGGVSQGIGQAFYTLPLAFLSGGAVNPMTTGGGTQLVNNAATLANPTTINATRKVLSNLSKNPNLIPSMTTSVGNQYLQAMNQGATREDAIRSAVISGVPSGIIELSGGLEGISGILANKTKGLAGKALQSALEEGFEEILQYPVENLGQKLAYDNNMPLLSMNENAVINPKQMAQAGLIGGLAGGLMGGGAAGINSAMEKRNSKIIDKEYNNIINSLPDDSPIMERVKELNDNVANITDEVKIWVINTARGNLNIDSDFDSETNQVLAKNYAPSSNISDENNLTKQTLNNEQTLLKTQNNSSKSTSPVFGVFEIKNINNGKEVKKNIYNFYKDSIISDSNTSKPIVNKNTGMNIELSRATINQTFQVDDKFKTAADNEIKIEAMANVVDIIQNGDVQILDSSETPSSKVKFAEVTNTININGVPYNITLDVRRTDKGNKYFVHSLSTDYQQQSNKTSGVINNGLERTINPNAYNILDKIGQATNIKIKIVSNITSPDGNNPDYANGQYDRSTNTLELSKLAGADDVLIEVAKHELTHMLSQKSPELYMEYQNYVINTLKEKGQYDSLYARMVRLHNEAGLDYTEDSIHEELAADAASMLFNDKNTINDIVQNNPTLGNKILEIIREIIKKFDNVIQEAKSTLFNMEQLRKSEQLWINALNDVIENKDNKIQNNTAADTNVGTTEEQAAITQYSLKDSEGRELTKEQQEFFKDSKVRDKNKNLLIMYHGTPNGNFTKFNSGSYFTQNKDYAEVYQSQGASSSGYKKTANNPSTYEVYLNIKKPFDTRKAKERKIFENEYYRQWGMGTPLMESGLPDWMDAEDLQEFIEENEYDYDGLILDEGGTGGYGDDVKSRGISYFIFNPEQVKNVDNTKPTKDADIRFSLKEPVEETKDLIAIHNITEEKLKGALELGGFPVPSIAILKAEQIHEGFGDLSVIFTKDTISPTNRQNKVFASDVYSPTFPRVSLRLDEKVTEKIRNRVYAATSEPDYRKKFNSHLDDQNISDKIERAKGNFVEAFKEDPLLQITYLKEKNIPFKPIMREKRYGSIETKILERVVKKLGNRIPEKYLGVDGTMEFEPEIRQIANDFYKEKLAGEDLYKEPFGFAKMDEFLREAKVYKNDTNRTEIDKNKTQEKLKKVVMKKGFEEWLNEISKNLVIEKGIRNKKDLFTPNGNRKSWKQLHDSYNLENVINLLKGDIRDEEGFNYGLGSLRANVSRQFKSIEDIKANKDLLVSDEEFMKVKEEYSNRYLELTSRAMAYHSSKYGDGYDYSMSSLAKKGIFTPSALKKEFKEDGFNKEILTDNELIKDSLDFLQELKDMPTSYFEAKPQRAVYLNEIAAVVTPKTANKELLQQLKEQNVKIVKYDEKIEGDRLRAVNSVKNVRFQLKDKSDSKDIERLKKANERLREEFKLTKGVQLDKNSIVKFAKNLKKDYSSNYSKEELETRLINLYQQIANNEIEYDDMLSETQSIARDIIENASILNDNMHKEYSELRSTLRNVSITLADKFKADLDVVGGYDAFRKRNLSRIKLTKDGMGVDVLYQELIEMYPEIFNADVTNQADQLMLIEEVLSGMIPVYENPFNYDMNNAVESLAMEIFEDFTSLQAAKPTFADKKKTELDKTKADNVQKLKALKEQQKDDIAWLKYQNKEKISQVLVKEKDKRVAAISKTKQKYSDESYKAWWKNKLKENSIKSHYQEMIKELRTSKNEKIEQTASKYKERISNIYEDRKVREEKASIKRKVKRLDAMLRKPTQKQHIPKIFERYIAELLSQINFETDKQKENTILKLRDLRAEYEKIAKVSDEDGIQAIADPYILDSLEMLHDKRLTDMNLEEIQILNNIVGYFEHMVKGYNKAFINGKWVDISTKSESILKELQTMNSVDESAYFLISQTKDMMKWGMITPQIYFERMGNTFYSFWEDLRNSLDVKINNTKIAQDYMKKLLYSELSESKNKEKRQEIKSWTGDKAKVTKFRLESGKPIELTPSQVMSLYLLFKREQAKSHILGFGIKPAPIVQIKGLKKEIKRQFEPVKVTPTDIAKIISSLTKEQKKIADGIGVFMNTYSKRWVNETTLANYGYELAKEENYFPIKSDKDFLKSEFDNANLDPTFTSMGFLKSTVKGAGNAIVIEDVFDVFTEHADKTATYNAFVTVTESIKKIINYKTKDSSIKQSMNKKHGIQAFSYLKKLMVDLQGGLRTDRGMPIVNMLIRVNKRSMLGLNLRTAIQQPTSIARASALIDIKYLVNGIAAKGDIEEMREHNPIALWKSWGYFNLDTGRTMKDIILDTTPLLDKQYFLIQKADDMAWSKLWNAVKFEIKDTTNLKEGSKEYFEAVSKRFSEIVDKTQVVDTVLHRSDVMRDKDSYVKVITSFMSEPIKQYNLELSAFEKFRKEKTPESRNELIRTTSSLIATMVIVSMTTAMFDMIHKDDDDKETFFDKWLGDMANNAIGVTPLTKDIYSIMQGYSVNRMEYTGITKVWRSFNRLYGYLEETAKGEKHKYQYGYIFTDFIESISFAFGISTANVTREMETVLKKYIKLTTNDDGIANDIYNFMFVKSYKKK